MAGEEPCGQVLKVHSYMLESHDETLKSLSSMPEVIRGLSEAVTRLNATMDKIEAKSQTQEACDERHKNLDILRLEQLTQLRESQTSQGKRIGAFEQSQIIKFQELRDELKALREAEIKVLQSDLDKARGAIRILQWGVPILVPLVIAITKLLRL